jgi:hypothetical protein
MALGRNVLKEKGNDGPALSYHVDDITLIHQHILFVIYFVYGRMN